MTRSSILGVPVDSLDMQDAMDRVHAFVAERSPRMIVPLNASKLWLMARDPGLDAIVRSAALVLPEKAILLGSRALGTPLKSTVGGVTLLKSLIPCAAQRGYRVYFLGAKSEVVDLMVRQLRERHPELQICGWHSGYFTPTEEAPIIAAIQASRPDLLFVAMGTPRQEMWISEHLHELGVPVCMGVGGSFDVLAGVKRDAPDWVRRLSVEWLYRLAQDPKNLWRRYLTTIPWFCYKVFAQKARAMRKAA